MGAQIEISAIILVGGKYDRKIYLECLQSLSWTDEIIKVDADKYKVSFAELRNMGASMAKGEWLFYVDTDEIVTTDLRREILSNLDNDFKSFAIPRKNIVFDQEMKHCGLWPDYVLRLIKKSNLVNWNGELHEQPNVKGEIVHLKSPLIHKKHDNLKDMVEKTNRWSDIEAKLMYDSGHPPMNVLRFFSAGIREFWLRMIVQTAFMNGTKGVIYGMYQVFSRLVSYSKLWELQIKKGIVK